MTEPVSVEALRKLGNCRYYCLSEQDDELILAAADEIERLRKHVRELTLERDQLCEELRDIGEEARFYD